MSKKQVLVTEDNIQATNILGIREQYRDRYWKNCLGNITPDLYSGSRSYEVQ
jgi:hypothetical protein